MTVPTPPAVSDAMREAVATPDVLKAFPGLLDRIVAAFGKAAWTEKGGISAHGSDDGGRIAMNHAGWTALPACLTEALAPIASEIARLTGERDAAQAAAESLHGNVVSLAGQIDLLSASIKEERRAAEAETARLRAALEKLLPSKLCGESWGLPDTDTVHIVISFGALREARAALTSQEKTDG